MLMRFLYNNFLQIASIFFFIGYSLLLQIITFFFINFIFIPTEKIILNENAKIFYKNFNNQKITNKKINKIFPKEFIKENIYRKSFDEYIKKISLQEPILKINNYLFFNSNNFIFGLNSNLYLEENQNNKYTENKIFSFIDLKEIDQYLIKELISFKNSLPENEFKFKIILENKSTIYLLILNKENNELENILLCFPWQKLSLTTIQKINSIKNKISDVYELNKFFNKNSHKKNILYDLRLNENLEANDNLLNSSLNQYNSSKEIKILCKPIDKNKIKEFYELF